jgi:hypothetical protein
MVDIRKCQIASISIALLSTVVSLAFIYIISSRYQYEIPIFEDLKDNFQSSPLISIKASNYPCEYPFRSLFKIDWEGVKSYCECWMITYSQVCSSNQVRQGCIARGNFSPVPLERFKNSYICAKDYVDITYDNIVQVEIDKNCPQDYRQCGKLEKAKLCIKNSESCPINDLVISPSQRGDLISLQYFEIEIINSKINSRLKFVPDIVLDRSNWYLYYSKSKIENNFVVDFRLSHKEACLHPREQRFGSGMDEHFNDYDYYVDFCSEFKGHWLDSRHKLIDQVNYYSLLQENKIISFIENESDLDISSLNYVANIYERGYVYFDQKCLISENNRNQEFRSALMGSLSSKHIEGKLEVLFF